MKRRHPRILICDKCGAKLKMERFELEGERFRKYYCPRCGFKETFKRIKDGYR